MAVQMLPSFIHLGHYELLCTSPYYIFLAMNGCKHFLRFLLKLLDNNKETVHVSLEKCRKAHLVLLASKKGKITKKIRGSAVNCFNWAIEKLHFWTGFTFQPVKLLPACNPH